MDEITIAIRDGKERDDIAFTSSTWANGMYYGNDTYRRIPEEVFFRWFPRILSSILLSGSTEIRIAYDQDRPEWYVGCAAFAGDALYWVYVKEGFRHSGLAKLLLSGREITTVKTLMPMTRAGRAIIDKKNWKYQPI